MHLSTMPLHLRRLLLGTSALTGFMALATTAQAGQAALPTGGVVTAGSAKIAQPSANQLAITTGTSRTVIDWQNFSIAAGNKVTIQQPGTSSITVNEVVGADPSRIFGDLSSNGRVVLANPNGLWFGPDSHVDVAGLVASTATLSNAAKQAFAAGGRLSLDTAGKATASIQNDGHLTIANAGLAALVAPGVRNNGVIQATLGSVTLASGTTSTLDFYGDGLVALAVTGPVTALALGPDGKPFQATIENNGKIQAGQVLVTADAVKGVVDAVINMSGVTEAKGVTVAGGEIVLDGGSGAVNVAGTLDASSVQAQGGNVQVTGGAVTLAATSKIDASGAKGGGTVQIGGGPHGGGTVKHAQAVTVKAGASIQANATRQGDGGTVSVWSDGLTTFNGSIEAKGAGTGNGGWVETSGHYLSIAGGRVDTSAPQGPSGTWLLDPFSLDIAHGGTSNSSTTTSTSSTAGSTVFDSDINASLVNGNVVLQTGGAGGDITVDAGAALSWTNSNNLKLDATANGGTGNILVNGSITGLNGFLTLSTNGTATQSAAIQVTGLELIGSGSYNLSTVPNLVAVLAIHAGSASVDANLNVGGETLGIVGGTTGVTTTGALNLSSTTGMTATSAISAGSAVLSSSAGAITISAPLSAGPVTLSSAGAVTQSQPITATSLELLGTGTTYTLTNASNNIGTLAANTGTVTLNNGSNPLTIGTAGGTSGATVTGTLSLNTTGAVTETAPIAAPSLELLGPAAIYTLTNPNNSIGTLAANTGTVSLNDGGHPFLIGAAGGTTGATVTGTLTLNTTGTVTEAAPITATNLELLGVGNAYSLTNAGNNIGTLAANTGSLTLTDGGNSLIIGIAGTTTGVTLASGSLSLSNASGITVNWPVKATAGNVLLTSSGSVSISSNVTSSGNFVASIGSGFYEGFFVTISAGGSVVIAPSVSGTAPVTIQGTIRGNGVAIESAGSQATTGNQITIGSSGSVTNTESVASNNSSSADLVFYSGPGSSILFNEGAHVSATAGNIAFITDSFVLNTPSSVSSISTPGTVIYSPASTTGFFAGPNLSLSGAQAGNGLAVTVGGTGTLVPQTLLDFLVGTGSNTAGQNSASNSALQIGLPGTSNTTSVSGTTSRPVATSIYGGGVGGLTVTGPINQVTSLTLNSNTSITVGANITAAGPFTANTSNGFTEAAGATITTTGTNSTVSISNSTTGGSAIAIGGAISASGPVDLFASSGGNVSVNSGASIAAPSFFSVIGPSGVFTEAAGATIAATGTFAQVSGNETASASTINIGGAITAPSIFLQTLYLRPAASAWNSNGAVSSPGAINIQGTANLTAPNIFMQSGPGGSVGIANGARLSSQSLNLYTDNLALGSTSSLATGFVLLDTGAHGFEAFTDSSLQTQEEPVLALGATTNPTYGLALSNATLTTLAGFVGTASVLIGEQTFSFSGATVALPVSVTATGSVTLPANTTIYADAFTQLSGTVNSSGFLTVNVRAPNEVTPSLTPPATTIALNGGITANFLTLNTPKLDGTGTLTAPNISLQGTPNLTVTGQLTTVGTLYVPVGAGDSFTLTSGASLTSNKGVIVYDSSSTSTGSTISIGGAITAPEIYLLASNHLSSPGGQITLGNTGALNNTNTNGSQDFSYRAATILDAGPGGAIAINSGATLNGGRTNIALISDVLTVAPSTTTTVSTLGRLIVSPASTNGELFTDASIGLPFLFAASGNGSSLLNFAPPSGVSTLLDIGVGSGSGAYVLNQTALTLLGGVPITLQGQPANSVARFQIGLPGATDTVNLAGTISLPTETGIFAGNINVAGNAAITIPSGSIQTFDTNGSVPGQPSGLLFNLVEVSASTSSSLSIASGASISTPGNIQVSSFCYSNTCAITPTASIAGTLTTGGGFFYFGSGNDQVTIQPGAVISSTGTPAVGGMSISGIAGLALGGTLLTAGGDIDIAAPVTLLPTAVTINTNANNSAGTGGAIIFESTLDAQVARSGSLALNAGSTGNISFGDLVGNIASLGAVTIGSAHDVNGPALNSTSLSNGTAEFQAASFAAGTTNSAIAGAFTMAGGLSVNPSTNALSQASSTSARTTGSIFINAAGAVAIGTVNTSNPANDLMVHARGADISGSTSNSSSVAGNGGTVTITGSSLTLAGVQARGGQSKAGSALVGNGGNGGTIVLTATNGGVTILGGLFDTGVSAQGGQSMLAAGGAGGNGGTITINATGNVIVPGGVRANGGSALAGIGGNAGSITIDAATIALGRALAQGGDTGATGTGAGGGAGGSITLIATGTGATDIILAGNNSDLTGTSTGNTYGTLLARSGNVGVTEVFNADQGGTATNAGGTILLEGSTTGAALAGAVALINSGINGVTAPGPTFGGGTNVVISASGASGKGGSVRILGSIVGADADTEGLRLGAANGTVTVTGDVGSKNGNHLSELVLAGNGGAITIGGTVAADAMIEQRTSGSYTIDGDISIASYTSPLGNTVLLSFPNTNSGNSSSNSGTSSSNSGSSSNSFNHVSFAGTFLLATPATLGNNVLTLIGTTVIDTSTNNSLVSLGSVDGAFGLTVNAGTGTVTSGAIGAKTALSSLTIKGGAINLGSVTTTGAQSYAGPTRFAATSTLAGSSVQFTSTVDGTVAGSQSLTITVTGSAELDGAIGGKTALQNFTLNASSVVGSLPSIFVTGAQTINLPNGAFSGSYTFNSFTDNGAMILSGDTVITATGGAITIGGTIDGAHALSLNDSVGLISLTGKVGSGTALTSLTLTGSKGIVLGGSITTTGGFTANGPVTMIGNTAINGGTGNITFGSTVQGQFNLALASTNANIFFDGTVGLSTARLSLLSITGANNATVLNNSSLFVHDFSASNIGGTLTFGLHSLESDDVVTIQATSVDGRVISTNSATINATTVSGIIQGSSVNVTASGAVNEQITADSASISGGSFAGSIAATRSANIAASGDVSANVQVSGGSATVSGANVSGSITSSGLAQISATQSISADISGGAVDIAAAGANVSGSITSTGGGPIVIAANNVSSTIVAQGGGTVQVAATGTISGSVTGGKVDLSAPIVNEQVTATSANISSSNVTVTGTIGGIDASAVQASASNVTQAVLGATQQVASNTVTDENATASAGDAGSAEGDATDEKKKKAKDQGAVYDFANQYIDNLIAGKKAN